MQTWDETRETMEGVRRDIAREKKEHVDEDGRGLNMSVTVRVGEGGSGESKWRGPQSATAGATVDTGLACTRDPLRWQAGCSHLHESILERRMQARPGDGEQGDRQSSQHGRRTPHIHAHGRNGETGRRGCGDGAWGHGRESMKGAGARGSWTD